MIYSHKILYYVNLKNYGAPLYTIFSIHSLIFSSLHLVLKHIQFSAYSVTSLNHINDFSIILIFRLQEDTNRKIQSPENHLPHAFRCSFLPESSTAPCKFATRL